MKKQVIIRSQNTQGHKGETLTASRTWVQRGNKDQVRVSMIQEAGARPKGYSWVPVKGNPLLYQATLLGRRGEVFVVHQTPSLRLPRGSKPGTKPKTPIRNSQMIFSSIPFDKDPFEVHSSKVGETQRPALAISTSEGIFASIHAVSGVPKLAKMQTDECYEGLQKGPLTRKRAKQMRILGGDFNHDADNSKKTTSTLGQVIRPRGATHQAGGRLDGFRTSSLAKYRVGRTTGMTGDHLGIEMTQEI